MHKSLDGGRTWKHSSEGIHAARIEAVSTAPRMGAVFVAMADLGLYRTTDRGMTFEHVSPSRPACAVGARGWKDRSQHRPRNLVDRARRAAQSLLAEPCRRIAVATTADDHRRKRILVPVGQSESHATMSVVRGLARDQGSLVRLLRVVPVPELVMGRYGRTIGELADRGAAVGLPTQSPMRAGDTAGPHRRCEVSLRRRGAVRRGRPGPA